MEMTALGSSSNAASHVVDDALVAVDDSVDDNDNERKRRVSSGNKSNKATHNELGRSMSPAPSLDENDLDYLAEVDHEDTYPDANNRNEMRSDLSLYNVDNNGDRSPHKSRRDYGMTTSATSTYLSSHSWDPARIVELAGGVRAHRTDSSVRRVGRRCQDTES